MRPGRQGPDRGVESPSVVSTRVSGRPASPTPCFCAARPRRVASVRAQPSGRATSGRRFRASASKSGPDSRLTSAGEKLAHHFTADEYGQKMRIYLMKACRTRPLKDQWTKRAPIKRRNHEHVVEAAQNGSIRTRKSCVYAAKPSSIRSPR